MILIQTTKKSSIASESLENKSEKAGDEFHAVTNDELENKEKGGKFMNKNRKTV